MRPHQTNQSKYPQETNKSIGGCMITKAVDPSQTLPTQSPASRSVPTPTKPRNLPQLLATFQLHASSPIPTHSLSTHKTNIQDDACWQCLRKPNL